MKLQEGLILVAIFYLAYTQLVMGQPQPRQDCQTRFGNVAVEYPFGISPGCYYAEDPNFELTCNETAKQLLSGSIPVINISHSGELRIMKAASYSCYNGTNLTDQDVYTTQIYSLTLSNKNRFTAVGCNTYAVMTTIKDRNYSTGCLSLCDSPPVENGQCLGEGCCYTSVPRGSNHFMITSRRFDNEASFSNFNPCFYAFLVEDGMFNFSATEDLRNLRNVKKFPVVLDWSIGNQTCAQAGNTRICGGNSTCSDSTTRSGYICTCNQGFDGNPYLSNGCQDINECTTSSSTHRHNCSDTSTCENTLGSFDCKCPSGYDFNTTTMSCALHITPKEEPQYLGWTTVLLGTTISFLIILLTASFIQQRMKRRKDTELRQKFFEQNGGGMLIQRLSGAGPSNVDVKIFTEVSMKKSTNGYDESRILCS